MGFLDTFLSVGLHEPNRSYRRKRGDFSAWLCCFSTSRSSLPLQLARCSFTTEVADNVSHAKL